jgi:alkanesulfonate monooxygenase SsuD/methylene tetrahydromethanopterin reductase-like flavin-dependent oxidoreductase (luciferase family)
MRLMRCGLLLGATVVAIAGAAPARAADAARQGAAPAKPEKEVSLGDLRIAVDPETGELRPLTPGEARKLTDEMKKRFPAREVALTQRPDGALSSVVAPNLLAFSVARVSADGTLETSCVGSPEQALAALQSAAQRASGPEEK